MEPTGTALIPIHCGEFEVIEVKRDAFRLKLGQGVFIWIYIIGGFEHGVKPGMMLPLETRIPIHHADTQATPLQ